MVEISKETQDKIILLQNLQRQMQIVASQRQRFDLEILQIDMALVELEKAAGKTFKAIGTLFIEAKPTELIKELNESRTTINARINSLKKQEEKLKTKIDEMQAKIEKELNPGGKQTAA